MPASEYLSIALNSLLQNKVRSALTMLGVIIGVLAVILLVALGEAAQEFIQREFDNLGSNLLRITPGKQETTGMAPIIAGSFRPLTTDNARMLAHQGKGISGVAPLVIGAGAVRRGNFQRDTVIFGVTEEFEPVRGFKTARGRFITNLDHEKNSPVCVLGNRVKEELFGDENAIQEKVSINRRTFLVVGIFQEIGVTLGMDMDDIVLIPLSASQQMFHGGEDELFQILVGVNSPDEIEMATESIRTLLTAAHDYVEDFTITDQGAIIDTFGRIFFVLRIMLAGLASISLFVGGIGIMNIMLVAVRERIKEVGIRKAVGARRRDIGFQFLAESVVLSLFGGATGVLTAVILTWIARLMYPIFPVYCSAWAILVALLFSFTVGTFFGVYPAVKAAGVDPVEALRYE